MALNTGEPFGPQNGSLEVVVSQIRATEIKAMASPMKSFLQLLEDSLNFTFTVLAAPALKLGGGVGRVVPSPVKGFWKPQKLPGVVLRFSFTIAKKEFLVIVISPLTGPPRG